MLQNDVRRARHRLNFSDWPAKLAEGPEEARASVNSICEELRADSMPLGSYRRVHRDAALSPAEVQTVCQWTETVKLP